MSGIALVRMPGPRIAEGIVTHVRREVVDPALVHPMAADAGQGRSADGTLIYEWRVAATGERRFEAKLWNGRDYRTILDQSVPAPKP